MDSEAMVKPGHTNAAASKFERSDFGNGMAIAAEALRLSLQSSQPKVRTFVIRDIPV
jgi:hypothetical protein